MRVGIILGLLCALLVGCSGSPPKPPEPKGEYRPVNKLPRLDYAKREGLFNFRFKGDISEAIAALKEAKPALRILSPVGTIRPVSVSVDIENVDLEAAMKAIADQCGEVANIVYQTRRDPEVHQAYIEYRESK